MNKRKKISTILLGSILVTMMCLTGLTTGLPQSTQATCTDVVPTVTGPIPVTGTSHPFDPAAGTNYQSLGYLQQEYFISGLANEYELVDPSNTSSFAVKVRTPNLPYVTRILIRYPANPARFSGNVIVEFLNPSGGYDIATAWLAYWHQIIANGDIWVGVTCKKSIVFTMCQGFPQGLDAFDAWRYAGGSGVYPPLFFSRDRAQAWDIFTQLGALLKSNLPSNPLVQDGFSVSNVKLIGHGYSQTGGYMITYINFFANTNNAKLCNGNPVYDGFLANSAGGPIWINDDGMDPCLPSMGFGPYPSTDPRRIIQPCGVPVIHTLTETEIALPGDLSALITRRPDSDTYPDLFRRYEIPGACHMGTEAFAWGPTNADIYGALHYVCPFCCQGTLSDFPAHYIHDAILANMELWIRNGALLPPKADRILTNASGVIMRDAFGNALGGIRSPWVDVPTKTYSPYSIACPTCPPPSLCASCSFWCSIFGNITPFSQATLNELYPSDGDYNFKFAQVATTMFMGHWLTGGDLATILGQKPQSIDTATGTGVATLTTSAGTMTGLTAAISTPCGTLPGFSFPHGFFSFNITNLTPGATAIITITLPSSMPVGTQYWKCINGHWVDCTSLLGSDDGDNIITLTITDGGLGDADGQANGTIVDPGGPARQLPAQAAPRVSPTLPNLKPAQMSLQYLNVNPQQASANQPVTILTNVVNTGDEAGSLNVALKINGQVEQTKMVNLGPQATQPIKFTVTKAQPGTYAIDIGGHTSSFTILGAGSTTTGRSANAGMIAILVFGVLVLIAVVAVLLARRPA